MNTLGYCALQLVTEKSIVFPGLTSGNLARESLYNDKAVRGIMERNHKTRKDFRKAELSRNLKRGKDTRSRGYEDVTLKEGDLVIYQHQGRKAWLGNENVFDVKKMQYLSSHNSYCFTRQETNCKKYQRRAKCQKRRRSSQSQDLALICHQLT